jgi:hypothetical protein
MAERHDNTRPAPNGMFTISPSGTLSYFQIEKSDGGLKPAMAVFLMEKTDGTLTAKIDTRFLGSIGEVDES